MIPWELSLTELRSNRDLTYSMDLKQAPLLPNYLFPQLPPFHLLQGDRGCYFLTLMSLFEKR